MKGILELLKKYGGTISDALCEIRIMDDGSGGVYDKDNNLLFYFYTADQLKKELEERIKNGTK